MNTPTALFLYQQLCNNLTPVYSRREAEQTAQMVLEHITRCRKLDWHLHPLLAVTPPQEAQIIQITQQLLAGVPVQYVLGEAFFYDMLLKVTPDVLIPRPETEELMLITATHINQLSATEPPILDIGTGSGCIAIGIKRLAPKAKVWAIDISPHALAVAKENARQYGVDITFLLCNILNPCQHKLLPHNLHVIVSNPPYIPIAESGQLMARVVEHEPHTALFVPNNDPLLFYRLIAQFAQSALLPGGTLFFETHQSYAHAVQNLLLTMGFSPCSIMPDMSGKPRMVKAEKAIG